MNTCGAVVRPPALSELNVPATKASVDDVAALAAIVGDAFALTDDEARIVHWAGRSVRDLIRTRAGNFSRVTDVVVYPGSERYRLGDDAWAVGLPELARGLATLQD